MKGYLKKVRVRCLGSPCCFSNPLPSAESDTLLTLLQGAAFFARVGKTSFEEFRSLSLQDSMRLWQFLMLPIEQHMNLHAYLHA